MAVRGKHDKCENRNDNENQLAYFTETRFFISIIYQQFDVIIYRYDFLLLIQFIVFFILISFDFVQEEFGDDVTHLLRSIYTLKNLQYQAILTSRFK